MSISSDERSPRFTRAILGRILAVVAFVCLGTFAVIQSVVGDRNQTANTQPEPSVMEPLQQKQPQSDKLAIKTPFQPNLKPIQARPGSSSTSPPASKSFTPPKPNSFGNNSFAAKPNTTAPKSATSPSINKFAANRPPIVVSKQSISGTAPPSSRFQPNTLPAKQPPDSAKALRGDTNFSARPTSTQPPTSPPAMNSTPKAFGNAFNDAAQKTNNIAQNLKNTASQTANGALDGAKNGFKSATNSFSDAAKPLRSSFGDRPNTTAKNGSVLNQPPGVARQLSPTQPRATLNTSRDLKPFRPTQQTSPAPSNAMGGQPSTAGRTQPDQRFRSTRSSPPSSPPQRQRIRSVDSSPIAASIPDAKTQETPGDRKLEGLRAPSLTVEKIAPREIQVNQPADFQIVVRNAGRVSATNVQVIDMIPAGTEFVSAVPQVVRSNSNELRWELGEMRPGQEKRIKLQLKPTRPGEIGSVAHVTFATQASMRTLVTKPELHIHHSAQPKVLIGESVILDITVENKGDGPANHVMIQEDVPSQLEFNDGYHELEYEIGTLAPGQSKKLKLALRAAEIGRLKNVLVASADGGLRAQHAIDMEVIAPQLVATGQGPTRKFLKREATHKFSLENKGTADASNIELTARLPSGLKFVAANNQGKYDPNSHTVYWSLAELTPNVVGSVEVKTLPIESGEQKINFEAVADLNQKAQASQTLVVEHLIDVFFDIDDLVDPIEIGSATSYVIRVVNQGTKTATNVHLQVDFPGGIQPVSVDGNLPYEIRGQQVLFDPITSMSPSDEVKLVVIGKGSSPGDHRVVVHMQTDGRETNVSKEETTRVYDDR